VRRVEEVVLLLGVGGSLMAGLLLLTWQLGLEAGGRLLDRRRSTRKRSGLRH
jgi:hypothetical protein